MTGRLSNPSFGQGKIVRSGQPGRPSMKHYLLMSSDLIQNGGSVNQILQVWA